MRANPELGDPPDSRRAAGWIDMDFARKRLGVGEVQI